MDFIAAHCGGLLQLHGGLFFSMFIAGLAGGFTHCIGMCSTFSVCNVPCVSTCSKSTPPVDYGLSYHLGRATTYGALGFFSSLLAKQLASLNAWPMISATMLATAGVMFLVSSLPECNHPINFFSGNLEYMKGVLTGFLPCGLLYSALMLAATTANPIGGMVAMWMFTLGTIPALGLANIGFGLIIKKYKNITQRITKSVMAINGLLLFIMAAKVMR